MPQIPIQAIDDPRLAPYRELSQRNLTRQSGLFVAEGSKRVERLIDRSFEVASVLAEPPFAARYEARLPACVPIYVAPRDVVEATVGFNFHRGVVACGRRGAAVSVVDILATLKQRQPTFVVCPDVQDPTNL